jgi:hypothetical protein
VAAPALERDSSRMILARLIGVSGIEPEPWSAADLRAILLHQLAAPVDGDLHAADAGRCGGACACRSFRDLLACDAPQADLLRSAKTFFKAAMRDDDTLPRDAARVLYLATIVCARRAGIAGVSTLDTTATAREVRRCLTFAWLPEDVRALLRQEDGGRRG